MPAERDIHAMLQRIRPLLGAHPDIIWDYLYYRSEIEFQKSRLDSAELKALNRFDRFLDKHRDWIKNDVYPLEDLREAREEFSPDHWWWWIV